MSLQLIKPSQWWQPAQFKTMHDKCLQGITVPAGFVTDGASVPRWLPVAGIVLLIAGHWLPILFIPAIGLILALAMFPRFGKSFDAALLHDFLLQQNPQQWRYANRMFLRQLKTDDLHCWRAYTMFFAVSFYQFFMWRIK
ncbi:hypothetical protein AB835_11645 [Candidatus Endobugula sertula]|uniref:DUF1353 domain-containing protein n=1 Tax=Candidatus Endobugula sertula TaxID=62101 RepID=A0A1D2QMT8_9GAMM|nr:hypothetical protein AB835_11645 [Candidatus Endobugula sertula]